MRFVLCMTVCLACSPAQGAIVDAEVPADVLADVQCVGAELLQGALMDPVAILAKCGSLLASQLLSLADDLLSAPTGTSVALVKSKMGHFPDIVLTDAQRSRVTGIRAATAALIASGAK